MVKKVCCIILAICLLAVTMIIVHKHGAQELAEIKGAYVVSIDRSGQEQRVNVKSQDIDTLEAVFAGKPVSEPGFVFETSGYRIDIELKNGKDTSLYPYCGGYDIIRAGNSGKKYFFLEDESSQDLKRLVERYVHRDKEETGMII